MPATNFPQQTGLGAPRRPARRSVLSCEVIVSTTREGTEEETVLPWLPSCKLVAVRSRLFLDTITPISSAVSTVQVNPIDLTRKKKNLLGDTGSSSRPAGSGGQPLVLR